MFPYFSENLDKAEKAIHDLLQYDENKSKIFL